MKLEPKFIIIHHSATPDRKGAFDFKAIREYHKSYGYKGRVITTEEAVRLMGEGKTVKRPWLEIGYHFVVEEIENEVAVMVGRMLDKPGAHCNVDGMNAQSIGICLVGNFNQYPVPYRQYSRALSLIRSLQNVFGIPLDNVKGHGEIAGTDCPGLQFNCAAFRGDLSMIS